MRKPPIKLIIIYLLFIYRLYSFIYLLCTGLYTDPKMHRDTFVSRYALRLLRFLSWYLRHTYILLYILVINCVYTVLRITSMTLVSFPVLRSFQTCTENFSYLGNPWQMKEYRFLFTSLLANHKIGMSLLFAPYHTYTKIAQAHTHIHHSIIIQ